MSIIDEFYFSVFQYFKPKLKNKANLIALIYISIFQTSILLFLGVFFAAFFRQIHLETISSEKGWTLFIIASLLIYFKNWVQYSGRKRSVINAKLTRRKAKKLNIWLLLALPVFIIALVIILMQVQ